MAFLVKRSRQSSTQRSVQGNASSSRLSRSLAPPLPSPSPRLSSCSASVAGVSRSRCSSATVADDRDSGHRPGDESQREGSRCGKRGGRHGGGYRLDRGHVLARNWRHGVCRRRRHGAGQGERRMHVHRLAGRRVAVPAGRNLPHHGRIENRPDEVGYLV
jgi:hypothetical protein